MIHDTLLFKRFEKLITTTVRSPYCEIYRLINLCVRSTYVPRNMRWIWVGFIARLHIGHFLRVLIVSRMHGPQNKWPHIVDMISSKPYESKQMGHFIVPGRTGDSCCGGALLAAAGAAAPAAWSVALFGWANEVSGMSHKSIVAIVRKRCSRRDSFTKITSSSDLTIGRIVLTFASSMSTTLSTI